jgi:FixJ family two-component response regulator
MDDFLAKPVTPKELSDAIQRQWQRLLINGAHKS